MLLATSRAVAGVWIGRRIRRKSRVGSGRRKVARRPGHRDIRNCPASHCDFLPRRKYAFAALGGYVLEPKPKFEGVTVKLAGVSYVVPPLSFKGWTQQEALIRAFWKAHEKALEELDATARIDPPFITKYLPIVHAAIARNCPEVTLAHLEEVLTLRDIPGFSDALSAALADDQEASVPGEARAAAR
jgi:hypothetical protein